MILSAISAILIILGLGQLAALLGVWYRHAIPRAPSLFRWLLAGPMVVSATSAFAVAFLALSGGQDVFGADAVLLLGIHFTSSALTWWLFNIYAMFHYHRSTRSSDKRMTSIDARLSRMEKQGEANRVQRDTDRGEEQADRREAREHRKPNE